MTRASVDLVLDAQIPVADAVKYVLYRARGQRLRATSTVVTTSEHRLGQLRYLRGHHAARSKRRDQRPRNRTKYDYDAAGRRNYETNDGRQVQYAYDAADNRQQVTWPDGYFVTYSYDVLHRMTYALERGTTELAFYSYDTLSRRVYECFGGQSAACLTGGGTNKQSYTYEPDSDLLSLTQTLNATTVGFGYTHYPSHKLKVLSANDPFYLPRPSASATIAYATNALNEYSSYSGHAVTSDLSGSLLTWYSALPSPGTHTYTYDSENRLLTAAVGGSGTASITYDYDGLGRRGKKTVNGSVTQYVLDGEEEIAELDGSGAVLRRFVTASQIDERIASIEGASTTPIASAHTYFHTDHEGSVIAMSDGAGNITGCAGGTGCQRLSYDEYGNLSSGASTTGQPFRYTGRRYDPETGLYFYRARYYSPALGRFLQVDPIGFKSDVNLYTYVYNDPTDKVDPSGTNELSPSDWKDFAIDVGTLLVDEIVYAAAKIGGNEGTAQAASDGMIEHRVDAAASTIGVISPAPGTGKAIKIAQRTAKAAVALKRSRIFKPKVWSNNKAKNNGKAKCDKCGDDVVPGKKLEKGDKVDPKRGEADHKKRLADGGADDADTNGELLCNPCHKAKTKEENTKPKPPETGQ